MTITLSATPAYPLPGKAVACVVTCTGGGNYWRIWATDAPVGSDLRDQIDSVEAARVELGSGSNGGTLRLTLDRGGCYVLTAQEYTRGTDYGGRYAGDPDEWPAETKIGAETALSLYVGQRVETTLGIAPDTATLVCYIWNDTIRRTFAATDGEATPAVVAPVTARARTAALSATVRAAALALSDVSAVTALGSPSAVLDNLLLKYNAHRTQAGVHSGNDTDNVVSRAMDGPSSPEGLTRAVQTAVAAMARHMSNDPNDGTGMGGASYHVVSTPKIDWTNWAKLRGGGQLDAVLSALGLAWSAYEAHRVDVSVHTAADSTNVATALPALLALHRDFASVAIAAAPSTPATVSTGVTTLVHGAGFREG